MTFLVLLILAIFFVPTFAAALISGLVQLIWFGFKLAFTFWQVTLFFVFILFVASLIG